MYLLLIMLFFYGTEASLTCSTQKSDFTCVCKQKSTFNSIITEVDCSRINLEKFPQTSFPSDLNLLDLSHNKLQILNATNNLTSLEILLLSYNEINHITDEFFQNNFNLQHLDLSHNQLEVLQDSLFENCNNLHILDLSFNNIQALQSEFFLPLNNLQDLNLSYNNHTLGALITNFIFNSNISSLKLDNLGLNKTENFFMNLTNLKHLSLADNHLEEIPRVPYTVEYLDLSGSDFTELHAKYFSYHSLKVLKLDRNIKLETISHYAFYNLEKLEELSVRNCRNLKQFNELIFGLLHKNLIYQLKRLELSGNGLQRLNSTYKYLFRKLEFADLSDNPWQCDCDLLWLQEFDNLQRTDYMKCSSPRSVSSKKFIDLSEKDLPSCYPQKFGKKSHRILISVLSLFVILLSALVGYLIYYAPSWYMNRTRNVATNSPYAS